MSSEATETVGEKTAGEMPSVLRAHRPLVGKVALVTGSGRGIGAGIAQELGAQGASIVVNYANSVDRAAAVVAQILQSGSDAIALKADARKPTEIFTLFEAAVTHFGRLDIVVSNSGTESFKREEDVTPEDFDYIFDLNCKAQFFVAQMALKYITAGGGGRLILMSSVAATMSGVPNHALYAGSKAAVEGFTRSFSVDCGVKGITVNAIAPGGVKTDMFPYGSKRSVNSPNVLQNMFDKFIEHVR